MRPYVTFIIIVFSSLILAYPVAALVSHGLDPALWPDAVTKPAEWFGYFPSFRAGNISDAYWQMLIGRSPTFAYGGFYYAVGLLCPTAAWIVVTLFGAPKQPLRDTSGVFGDARFATPAELSGMNRGLELGKVPKWGNVVRVTVEGTLITIAPPRKGKTSGLLIPNLAFPEAGSWDGPAVVIDTKGEVYRAVGDRRRALGRKVICLDPLRLVDGQDRWNPLRNIDPADILYLQRTALALLPETTGHDEASAYFRNRAVDLISAAMIAAIAVGRPTPGAVSKLLSDDALFIKALNEAEKKSPPVQAALDIMQADPKTRDPIKSTALQAFQWVADGRLRWLVDKSTFDLSELSSGQADLFIAVPPEYKRLLAPFLRWLLSDLFASIRARRPIERVLVFVDEAAALGRFDEILTAAAELPGYGASLWTLWQDRSQIVSLYGEAGASTLLNTAEVVTVFNLSSVDPDETERWSRTLGDYTALISSTSSNTEGKGASTTTRAPQAARLMTPSALIGMPSGELLAFINSSAYPSRPMRLDKTVAHNDSRFERLIQSTRPVK